MVAELINAVLEPLPAAASPKRKRPRKKPAAQAAPDASTAPAAEPKRLPRQPNRHRLRRKRPPMRRRPSSRHRSPRARTRSSSAAATPSGRSRAASTVSRPLHDDLSRQLQQDQQPGPHRAGPGLPVPHDALPNARNASQAAEGRGDRLTDAAAGPFKSFRGPPLHAHIRSPMWRKSAASESRRFI